MAVEIKICGVTEAVSIDAALNARVDYLGFNFVPTSPRQVRLDQAAALAARARGRSRIVALVADADDAWLDAVVRAARPDFLQLHGHESPARSAAIRARFGIALIKALPIARAEDFAPVTAYQDACDRFLFDAKAPAAAVLQGGHGAAFDWQLLQGRRFGRPWLLAGGLTADNVACAITTSGAPGVDVSSGVEVRPGVKDGALIAAFAAAARTDQSGAAASRMEDKA